MQIYEFILRFQVQYFVFLNILAASRLLIFVKIVDIRVHECFDLFYCQALLLGSFRKDDFGVAVYLDKLGAVDFEDFFTLVFILHFPGL